MNGYAPREESHGARIDGTSGAASAWRRAGRGLAAWPSPTKMLNVFAQALRWLISGEIKTRRRAPTRCSRAASPSFSRQRLAATMTAPSRQWWSFRRSMHMVSGSPTDQGGEGEVRAAIEAVDQDTEAISSQFCAYARAPFCLVSGKPMGLLVRSGGSLVQALETRNSCWPGLARER